MNKEIKDNIYLIAGEMQKEAHRTIEVVMKSNPKIKYQDAMNTLFFIAIAGLRMSADMVDKSELDVWKSINELMKDKSNV